MVSGARHGRNLRKSLALARNLSASCADNEPMSKSAGRGLRLSAAAKKRLKYYLCLDYPLQVTLLGDGWHGSYCDLPGVSLVDTDLTALFTRLDQLRRTVLGEAVALELDIPLPNTGPVDFDTSPARQLPQAARSVSA
jgi:hypothetical protein